MQKHSTIVKSPPPILYEFGKDFYVVDYYQSVFVRFSEIMRRSLLIHLN